MVEIRSQTHRTKDDNSFTMTIEAPEKHPTSGDYFCRVSSSEGLQFRVDVFGVDPQQAIRLALEMAAGKVAKILSDAVTDDSGEPEGHSDMAE